MNLNELRQQNESRRLRWQGDGAKSQGSLSFAMMELAGEAGEACNAAKKIERAENGWKGGDPDISKLADELADVVICADLAAIRAGIDLAAAVARKFNATSEKHGFPERLSEGAGT